MNTYVAPWNGKLSKFEYINLYVQQWRQTTQWTSSAIPVIKCNSLVSRTNIIAATMCTLFWIKSLESWYKIIIWTLWAVCCYSLKLKLQNQTKYLYYLSNPHTHIYIWFQRCKSVLQKSPEKKLLQIHIPEPAVSCLSSTSYHVTFCMESFKDNISR